MNAVADRLNEWGTLFCAQAWAMLLQSGLLILALYLLDGALKKHLRATLRYGLWLLVVVKLVLPPGLALPSGAGYWFSRTGQALNRTATPAQPPVSMAQTAPSPGAPPASAAGRAASPNVPAAVPQAAPARRTASWADMTPAPMPAPMPDLTPAMAPAPRAVPLSPQGLLLALWLLGLAGLGTLLLRRLLHERALLRQTEAAPARLREALARARQESGMKRTVEVRLTERLACPAACGILRPRILVPAALAGKLTDANLKAVLLHELSHIERGDLWLNFAQALLQVFYFYNPLVWLANACIRRVREQAVDEAVLARIRDGEVRMYSNTLLAIAASSLPAASLGLRLVGVVESKSKLEERIRLMMQRPIPQQARLGLKGLIVVLFVGAVVLPMAGAQSEAERNAPVVRAAPAEMRADLARQNERYWTGIQKAWNNGDANGMLAFYADQGAILLSQRELVAGRNEITSLFNDYLSSPLKLSSIKNEPVNTWVSGDLVFEIGTYHAAMKVQEQPPEIPDVESYLAVSRRQADGSLKLEVDARNPIKSPAIAAATAAAAAARPPAVLWVGDLKTSAGAGKITDQLAALIREKERAFHRLFVDEKLAEAGESYAKDAILLAADAPLVRGQKEIAAFIQAGSQGGYKTIDIAQEMVRVEGNENTVYVVNKFTWTLKSMALPDAPPLVIPGKGVHVWIREAGGWKILLDLNNASIKTDAAAEPAPPEIKVTPPPAAPAAAGGSAATRDLRQRITQGLGHRGGRPPYPALAKNFTEADLPALFAILKDTGATPSERDGARGVIWNISRRNNDQVVEELAAFFKQPMNLEPWRSDPRALRDHIWEWMETLETIGRVGGGRAEAILKQALTEDGAAALTRNWIAGVPPEFFSREAVLANTRGSAALGLAYLNTPAAQALVKAEYERERQECIQADTISRCYQELSHAMMTMDLIQELGFEGERAWVGSDRGPDPIQKYFRKYQLNLKHWETDTSISTVSLRRREAAAAPAAGGRSSANDRTTTQPGMTPQRAVKIRIDSPSSSISDVAKNFTEADLPAFFEIINNEDTPAHDTSIAMAIIGNISGPNNEKVVDQLLDFIKRPVNWEKWTGNNPALAGVAGNKCNALNALGRVGGDKSETILKQALTASGAQELAKDWIAGWPPNFLPLDKENVLGMLRGAAAGALARHEKYQGLIQTEYAREREACIKAGTQSRYYGGLASAMMRMDALKEIGPGGDPNQLRTLMSKYFLKYQLNLPDSKTSSSTPNPR